MPTLTRNKSKAAGMKENDGTLDKFLKSPGKKGSSPKGNGRQSRAKAEKDRIKELLRLNDSDYPPSNQEVEAAIRVIELEKALKSTKRKDQDEVEKELKEAIKDLFKMISVRTTKCDKGGKDDPIELESMDVDESPIANKPDSHMDQQMDIDSGGEPEVQEVEMEETGNIGPNEDTMEKPDADMQNQDSGANRASVRSKNPDEKVSEDKIDDSPKPKNVDVDTKLKSTSNTGNDQGKNIQNPYAVRTLKNNAWKGSKTMKEAVLAEKMVEPKGKHTFRIRAVVETKQSDNLDLTLLTEKQRILNSLEPLVKKVDAKALILDWNGTSAEDKAAYNTSKLSPYTAGKYIGLPNNRKSLGTGKNKVGLRINSNLTLNQFIDAWGKNRKEKGWVFVTQSEMQSSPTAFAVGVCQGSSPNMVTNLINRNLEKVLETKEVKVEVSWQHITREDIGVTTINEMWKKAKNKSEEETPSGVQKNRILNLYSPSGLVVYVSCRSAKKLIRRKMMEMYGSGKTYKEWATWPDGSMMRFIPYLSPTSQPRHKEKLKAMLYHQIFTKANETSRDLEAIDLFTEKEYLNGMTLQEAILKLPAEKMKGMPVFKHITKKWTRNHLETKYQITSYATLSEEANATIPGLLSLLQEKYGNKILKHFPGESLLDSYSNSKERYLEDEDPILEKMFAETKGDVEEILAPGWISLVDMQAAGFAPQSEQTETQLLNDGESTIQLSTDTGGETTKSSEWKTTGKSHYSSSKENTMDADRMEEEMTASSSIQDSISLLTDASDDTIQTENTGEDTVSTEQRRKWKEKKSINKKLIAINASHEDLEQWKKDHPLQLSVAKSMASISNSPEYKTDTLIINLMEADLKENEKQSHMEVETSEPSQEPTEQLIENAPDGP